MRALVPLVLAALMALAGCNGQGGTGDPTSTPTTPGPTTPTTPDEPTAELPEWTIGQGWTYAVEVPGEPTHTFNMMVAEDREEDNLWIVASDDREQAVHHAVYSTNPVLGRISKDTLSPFQDGQPVSMFRFPLTDGKTWSATFFGESMDFTATFEAIDVDDDLGLGAQTEGFRIRAEGNSGLVVDYDYVEGVEWFTSFEVLTASGERQIKLTLQELIEDYTGPYYFFRGADALVTERSHAASSGVTTTSDPAPVPVDRSERVAIGLVYTGVEGQTPPSLNVTLSDPDGAERWSRELTGATQRTTLADVAGTDGDWTVAYRMVGNLDVEVRVVGMLLFSQGTL